MRASKKILVLVLAIGTIFTACGGTESKSAQNKDDHSRQKLLLWSYYETEAQATGLSQLVDGFNSNQDEYYLSWEYVPMSEFDKRISRAYTEQELPDIVIIDNPDMKQFIQLDMFENITEYANSLNLEEYYYAPAVNTTKYNGEYYGVPFNSNNVCLIYRPDLFKEANVTPPDNWSEFVQVSQKLTDEDTYGFLMSAIDSEQGAFQLLTWVMAASKSDYQISQDAIEASYELLSGLIDKGCMPSDCLNYSQNDVARRFIEGDIAMMENGPWVFPLLDEAGIDYALAPMPQNNRKAVILGGENLGIIKGKNVEGSIEFIKYCMEDTAVEDFCKKANLLPSKVESAKIIINDNPKLEIIEDQMENAVVRTDIEDYSSISGQLTKNFEKVVTGDMTAEEAARETLK